MNIILVMIEAPVPFGGAASRWFYCLTKELVARGHQLELFITSTRPQDLQVTLDEFPTLKNNIHFHGPAKKSLVGKWRSLRRPYVYMFSEEFERKLQQRLERPFDLIHAEQLWSANVLIPYRHKTLINIHYLLHIDLEFEKIGRWERFQFERQEKKLTKLFPYLRTLSKRIKNQIEQWHPREDKIIRAITMAIDPSKYRFIQDHERENNFTIGLTASMGWYPGKSAAIRLLENIWPIIKKNLPQAKLLIVGWSARQVLHQYLEMPDVTILENVPSIEEYFKKMSVLVYPPVRGSGNKVKVMESMLYGVPVVTTSEGVEGLAAVDQQHFINGEDDQEIANKTIDLLQQIDLQNKIRKNARVMMEANHSPEVTVDQIEKLYSDILNRRPSLT